MRTQNQDTGDPFPPRAASTLLDGNVLSGARLRIAYAGAESRNVITSWLPLLASRRSVVGTVGQMVLPRRVGGTARRGQKGGQRRPLRRELSRHRADRLKALFRALRHPDRDRARTNRCDGRRAQRLNNDVVVLRDDVPIASRIEADIAAADEAGAVHQPHRRRAVIVLPEDVGLAVAVVVAGLERMP
jgi:hypothetical protein